MTESTVRIKWAAEVADHDYAAAQAYLSLKLGEEAVAKAVQRLKKARERHPARGWTGGCAAQRPGRDEGSDQGDRG
jgi:UDP-N-acetylenolpyruvoylglucosamine reductase